MRHIKLSKVLCRSNRARIFVSSNRCLSSFNSDFVSVDADGCTSSDNILGVTRNDFSFRNKPHSRLGLPLEREPTSAEASLKETAEQSLGVEGAFDDALEVIDEKEALPFDDEKFAEKVLEMEAEGAIDECWQDSRKAHFEDVKELSRILETMKVRNVCCVDTSEKTSSFDYIMFGTCEGSRHIHLAAWAVQESDRVHRISKVKRKKTDETWEVVPVGRILINLMTENLRESLSLERKWAVTSNMDPLKVANAAVSEGRLAKAHGLWSLTLNIQDLEDFEIDYCKDTLLQQR